MTRLTGGIVLIFSIVLMLNGCGTIANTIISGQPPSLSLSTAKEAESELFKKEDFSEFPMESLNDSAAGNYANALYAVLTKCNDNRNSGEIELLNTARIQGMSDSLTGEIQITRGMLNSIRNEAELVCLIGHEIGHQTLKHFERRNQKDPLGMALSKGLEYVKENQELLAELNREQGEIRQSGWSKDMEIEADKFGADLAAKAGYDPYAFCDLFERLSKKVVDNDLYRIKKLKGTHPALADRVDILRKYLQSKDISPARAKRTGKTTLRRCPGL